MRGTSWAWIRILGGAIVVAVLLGRLGIRPVVSGLRAISGWSLATAVLITVATTACSAWRWSLVARGLGVPVPLRSAIAAYYRSQFLNVALPGGVFGDVHRAVRHGRDVGDVGRGVRAVAWERCAGQVVQIAVALMVFLVVPSPVRSSMPHVIAALAVAAGVAVLLAQALSSRHPRPARWTGGLRMAREDLRAGLLAPRAWPGIALASVVVLAGHAATFVIAARATGSTEPAVRMLPLALLVLLAMAVPTNIGGWGPREGVAAWSFAAAGLGAGAGVAAAAAYGVLVFAASLPGAAVLVVARFVPGARGDGGSVLASNRTKGAADG